MAPGLAYGGSAWRAARWLTDFADQSVVLPVSAAVLAWLLLARWWRGAACWVLLVLGALGTMLTLKLFVGACGWEAPRLGLNSPSGHTASAAMLYGGLCVLLLPRAQGGRAVLIAAGFSGAAALTRLLLGVHTLPEVAVGALVGTGAIVLFGRARGPVPRSLRPGWPLLVALALALSLHGHRLGAEQAVRSLAVTRLRALICPMGTEGAQRLHGATLSGRSRSA